MSEYQNIIDREQNAIISRANAMTDSELIFAICQFEQDDWALKYLPNRKAYIDLYCQLMFELNNL